MSPEFFYMMNVVLVSRLVYLLRDGPLGADGLAFLCSVLVVGSMALQPGIAWAILLALLLLNVLIFNRLERGRSRNEGLRLLSLAVQTALLSVFFSPWIGVFFNDGLISLMTGIGYVTLLVPILSRAWHPGAEVVVTGGLLVLNEANYVLRLLLGNLRVGPVALAGNGAEMTPADRREYNTGRVIGILERIMIFVAVMTNQIAAIGLVLAVKGLARFKEMDHRSFAEYVLVGTLLSALLAVLAALGVKSLL